MIDETTCYSAELSHQEPVVCVPITQYERYIRLAWLAENMAETVAEDWITGAEQGFSEPSEALKILLKLYDLGLYRCTAEIAKDAEDRHKKELSEKLEREFQKQAPAVYPYIPQDTPGCPYKGVEITCDAGEGEKG